MKRGRGRIRKYDGRRFDDNSCSGGRRFRGVRLGWDSYGKMVLLRKANKYKKVVETSE